MTTHNASLVTPAGILMFVNGQMVSIANDHPNVSKIKDAISTGDYATAVEYADTKAVARKWLSTDKDFTLEGSAVALHGDPFSVKVTDKVLNMIEAGHNPEPLFKFLRKVRLNPSKTAQDELLLFCVANGFMIHEDGDIIAYKSLRGDYRDIHSGTVLAKPAHLMTPEELVKYTPGVKQGDVTTKVVNGITTISMARHKVDDNRDNTCSVGLHFAAHKYASTWAGAIDGVNRRLIVMKVSPTDVVSIPSDYHNEKGRCWSYQAIAELPSSKPMPKKEVYTPADCGCPPDVCLGQSAGAGDHSHIVTITIEGVQLDNRAQRLAFLRTEIADLDANISKKEATLKKFEAEQLELATKMQKIRDLGGFPSATIAARFARVQEVIRDVRAERVELLDARQEAAEEMAQLQ